MLGCMALASSIIATTHATTVTADPNSPSYLQGSADRASWETWFQSLSSTEKDGAMYWSNQRSRKTPIPCSAHASFGDDWLAGCTGAKQRLTSVDIKRNSDPQYWDGWNKVGTALPVAQATSNGPTSPLGESHFPGERELPREAASPDDLVKIFTGTVLPLIVQRTAATNPVL